MCIGGTRKPKIEQPVGGEWDVKDLIGRTEEWAAIQSVMSILCIRLQAGFTTSSVLN
jgi:hypothetical protein